MQKSKMKFRTKQHFTFHQLSRSNWHIILVFRILTSVSATHSWIDLKTKPNMNNDWTKFPFFLQKRQDISNSLHSNENWRRNYLLIYAATKIFLQDINKENEKKKRRPNTTTKKNITLLKGVSFSFFFIVIIHSFIFIFF